MQPKSLGRLLLALLFFALLSLSMVCAQGGASASQSVTVSIPPSVSQDGFRGSVPAQGLSPTPVSISFLDAIDRGLKQNLGLLLSGDNTLAARGEKWKELSNLLPNVEAKGQETVQQTSLAVLGLRIPGFPRVLGPLNYLDARAFLNQSVFNWNYIQKERAAADLEGDYGDIGVNPGNSNGTFHVSGTITVPVFQGGRLTRMFCRRKQLFGRPGRDWTIFAGKSTTTSAPRYSI